MEQTSRVENGGAVNFSDNRSSILSNCSDLSQRYQRSGLQTTDWHMLNHLVEKLDKSVIFHAWFHSSTDFLINDSDRSIKRLLNSHMSLWENHCKVERET